MDKGARTKARVFKGDGKTPPKPVGGQPWTGYKVQRIIGKPLYKGIRVDAKGTEIAGIWKPLVTARCWTEANAAMKARTPLHSLKVASNIGELALKGLLHCGRCGFAMTPKLGGKPDAEGNQRPYYTCQDVIRHGGKSGCDVRNLPGRDFDAFTVRMISELGKRPEVIQATLRAAQESKQKSIRPMKSELSGLNRKLQQLDGEIRNCIATAKASGIGHFTKALMEESEKLAKERDKTLQAHDRLKLEIRARESAVADQQHVAQALGNFSRLYEVMSFEERRELMDLLIKRVSVARFNPERDNFPSDRSVFQNQPSTEWYRLDFDFHIKSMFAAGNSAASPVKTSGTTGAKTGSVRTMMPANPPKSAQGCRSPS